jgi:aminoglycoside phosphotransferase (APT) family kinase protein
MVESTVIEYWLAACLHQPVSVERMNVLGGGSGCTVAECWFDGRTAVLKVYHPSFDDFSQLGPEATVQKHALALTELPRHGIPTPGLLGWATRNREAAVLTERLPALVPSHQTDEEAAGVLTRLHAVQPSNLSESLASLIGRSRPNAQRVMNGVIEMTHRLDRQSPSWRTSHRSLVDHVQVLIDTGEPDWENPSVIHGDFFGVNFRLRPPAEIAVIDWDLLSLGDPMWDLAFLIGADPHLASSSRRTRILRAYQGTISTQRLEWHLSSWQAFWKLRELINDTPEAADPHP